MSKRFLVSLICITFLLALRPPTAVAAGETLFVDFEDGTVMGFDVRGTEQEKAAGTGVLTVETEEAHSGQYSLLITERKQSWNGPAFNMIPYLVPGASCEISVWVLPKTPDSSTFMLSTQIGEGSDAEYITLQSKTVSNANEWIELTGQYTYGNDDFITVYIENSTSSAEFYIDDFSFSVSEADEPFQEWNPATDPLTNNKRGIYDGFDYEFWSQNTDEGSMMLTGGGTFECQWDGFNLLFRTGKRLGSTMPYTEYGNITIDYAAEHNIISGDVSYLCVYGWTEDPMIEFYVVDNYGSYKPPGGVGYMGEIEVDGGTYEVYVNTRVDMPSIQGTKTFQQYFSVRVDKRTEGTITLSDHFKAWEALGLDMSGKMYEVSLCVEGFDGSGSANVYKHVLTTGDTVYGTPGEPLKKEDAQQSDNATDTSGTEQLVASDMADEPKSNAYIFIIAALGILAVGAVIIVVAGKRGGK